MKRFLLTLAIFVTASMATMNNVSANDSVAITEHWQSPDSREKLDAKLNEFLMQLYIASGDEVRSQQITQEMSEWVDSLNDVDSAYVLGKISELLREANSEHEGVDTASLDAKIDGYINRFVQAQLDSDGSAIAQIESELESWLQSLSEYEQIYATERLMAILSDVNQMRHDVFSRKVDITEAEIESKIDIYYSRILLCTSERGADMISQEMNEWIQTLNSEDSKYAVSYMRRRFFGGNDDSELSEARKAEIRLIVEDYFNEMLLATAKGDQMRIEELRKQIDMKTENFTMAEAGYFLELIEEFTATLSK